MQPEYNKNPLGAIPYRPSTSAEPASLDCTECRAIIQREKAIVQHDMTSIAERRRAFQRQAARDRAAGFAAMVAVTGFILAGAWAIASLFARLG
jgi:hypothetical protein